MDSPYRGLRTEDGQSGFVYGYHFFDGEKHWILTKHPEGKFCHADEVSCYDRNTTRTDKEGSPIYENDIITLLTGELAEVHYGEYPAYCPEDEEWMTNIGFYVTAEAREVMPLGPTEYYAVLAGNTHEKKG